MLAEITPRDLYLRKRCHFHVVETAVYYSQRLQTRRRDATCYWRQIVCRVLPILTILV